MTTRSGQRFDSAKSPARSVCARGVLPAGLRSRSLHATRVHGGPRAAGRVAARAVRRSIGAAMRARATRTTRSSTSCTSRASPRERTPASRRRSAAPLPGLIEKIPYLKELGVTVVELLPVHQFDPQEGNYWGYMTLQLLRAASRATPAATRIDEFRAMVRGVSRGGHRGVAGRGLQPHQRRRRDRADLFATAASTTPATTCCTPDRRTTSTTPAAATRCAAPSPPRACWC